MLQKTQKLSPPPPPTHLYTYSKMHKQVHAVISTHSHMHTHAMFIFLLHFFHYVTTFYRNTPILQPARTSWQNYCVCCVV